MLDLAKQVVRDGEGATRVCTYTVTGAISDARGARRPRAAVAENVLVKCALHGGDPNWGRILAALGAAGVHLDPDRVAVVVGGVPIVFDAAPASPAASRRPPRSWPTARSPWPSTSAWGPEARP